MRVCSATMKYGSAPRNVALCTSGYALHCTYFTSPQNLGHGHAWISVQRLCHGSTPVNVKLHCIARDTQVARRVVVYERCGGESTNPGIMLYPPGYRCQHRRGRFSAALGGLGRPGGLSGAHRRAVPTQRHLSGSEAPRGAMTVMPFRQHRPRLNLMPCTVVRRAPPRLPFHLLP